MILRTALILFGQFGRDGVSMRMIAAAANVRLSALYYYFEDKAGIYQLAVHDAFAFVNERMVGASRSTAVGEARLQAFLRELVELHGSGLPEMRLVDRELMEPDPVVLEQIGVDLFQKPFDALVEILRDLAPQAPVQDIAEHVIALAYGSNRLRPLRRHLSSVSRLQDGPGIAESLYDFTLASLRGARAR